MIGCSGSLAFSYWLLVTSLLRQLHVRIVRCRSVLWSAVLWRLGAKKEKKTLKNTGPCIV